MYYICASKMWYCGNLICQVHSEPLIQPNFSIKYGKYVQVHRHSQGKGQVVCILVCLTLIKILVFWSNGYNFVQL